MQSYVHHILEAYFGPVAESLWHDAVTRLKEAVHRNETLRTGIIDDLRVALSSKDYPWKDDLENYEVEFVDSDQEGREYMIDLARMVFPDQQWP